MAAMTARDYDRHVEHALGPDRLDRYLRACSDDVTAALRLYEWNCAVSSALFEVLGDVEVVVRQALHRELSEWHESRGFPGEWYDNAHGLLMPSAVADIAKARQRLMRKRVTISPAGVIAELPFGFWRYLMTRPYSSTIWPIVSKGAFPHVPGSGYQKLWARVARLHTLRNLIAHHEPIFWRKIQRDMNDCMLTLRGVSKEAEHWSRSRTQFEVLITLQPEHGSV